MKEQNIIKTNTKRFFWLGTYVLFSVAINQWINIALYRDFWGILWFCDATAVILGIGLILKNTNLTTLSLVTAIPAQLPWIIDFFLEATGSGMGRTATIWSWGPSVFWASVNLHAIIIPISLYAVWKLGFSEKSLKLILLYGLLLLTATYLFSPVSGNRNCVFFGCDERTPGTGYLRHFLINSLLYWEVIWAISFFILRFLFKKISPVR